MSEFIEGSIKLPSTPQVSPEEDFANELLQGITINDATTVERLEEAARSWTPDVTNVLRYVQDAASKLGEYIPWESIVDLIEQLSGEIGLWGSMHPDQVKELAGNLFTKIAPQILGMGEQSVTNYPLTVFLSLLSHESPEWFADLLPAISRGVAPSWLSNGPALLINAFLGGAGGNSILGSFQDSSGESWTYTALPNGMLLALADNQNSNLLPVRVYNNGISLKQAGISEALSKVPIIGNFLNEAASVASTVYDVQNVIKFAQQQIRDDVLNVNALKNKAIDVAKSKLAELIHEFQVHKAKQQVNPISKAEQIALKKQFDSNATESVKDEDVIGSHEHTNVNSPTNPLNEGGIAGSNANQPDIEGALSVLNEVLAVPIVEDDSFWRSRHREDVERMNNRRRR